MNTKPTRQKPQAQSPQELASDVPLIYAETLMGVAIGPFVSKFILGTEAIGQEPVAKYQIALPTNLMHTLAKQIIDVLGDQGNQAQLLQAFQQYQQELSGQS